MEKYDEYKDSGVEWIGEVPENWVFQKLKFLGKMYPGLSGKAGPDFHKEYVEGTKPFIAFTDIYNNRQILSSGGQYVAVSNSENQNKVKKGDLLFLMSSETLEEVGLCSVYQGDEDEVYLNSFCKGLHLESSLIRESYLNYLLGSGSYRKYFTTVGRGFTRINIKQDYIREIPTLIPPLPTQTAIAHFLDRKTAQIDRAIAQQERLIALLRERKQIVIQQAVTKGLDPTVKMKDSGVEWIGEVPEGWEIRKMRFLCDTKTGDKNTEDKVKNGSYPFFVRSQKPETINSYSFDGEAILTAGDGAGVGKVYHYIDGKFDYHQRVYKFSNFREVLGKYLFYFLRENFARVALLGTAKSTVDSLRLPMILDFEVCFPISEETQSYIIAHIEKASSQIVQSIHLHTQQIAKLKEYRTVLIDAAVTGKIKVPD